MVVLHFELASLGRCEWASTVFHLVATISYVLMHRATLFHHHVVMLAIWFDDSINDWRRDKSEERNDVMAKHKRCIDEKSAKRKRKLKDATYASAHTKSRKEH